MARTSLPPGFRFHPTDDELVDYYLKRKVEGLEIELEVIPVIDLYKYDPWELPEKSFLPKRDMEWFFFCPRDRKYPNGMRTNRATKAGYWKATGKDRKIVCKSSVTGYRKTLVFYRGRAPLGDRTDWIMHEYRLSDGTNQGTPSFVGAFALCRVVKKNEVIQKSSDSIGEPKAKVVASGSSNGDFNSGGMSSEPMNVAFNDMLSQSGYHSSQSRYAIATLSPYVGDATPTSTPSFQHIPMEMDSSNLWVSPDLILDSSKDYPQLEEIASQYFPHVEYQTSMNQNHQPCSSHRLSNPTDDLTRFGYMTPYPQGHGTYMDVYRNEDTTYEGYDPIGSLNYMNYKHR